MLAGGGANARAKGGGRRTLERLDVAARQRDADLVDLGALAEVLLGLVCARAACQSGYMALADAERGGTN